MTTSIPDGYHTVTPYFLVKNGTRFIQFLEQAFGGELKSRHDAPDGHLVHAAVRIGSSMVMLGEPPPPHSPTSTMMYLYVPDADAIHARAIQAGGVILAPMADQFYGDRAGAVQDPEGNAWWIATRKENLSDQDITRRQKKN